MTLVYDGVQYEVETEGGIETINLLEDDEHDNNLVPHKSKHFQDSCWTAKIMHLFLDECIKRKTLIRDPNIQKQKVFFAIHKQLKTKGYVFKAISLERKLRTMKKHFMFVSAKNPNPSNWQYYEKMKTLYPDCVNQQHYKDTTQPLANNEPNNSTSDLPRMCKESKSYYTFSNTGLTSQENAITHLILKDSPSSTLSGFTFNKKGTPTTDWGSKNFEKPANIQQLRNEILCLEERRTLATEKILKEMRLSNKLKEEMLDLNIKLFEATKRLEEY